MPKLAPEQIDEVKQDLGLELLAFTGLSRPERETSAAVAYGGFAIAAMFGVITAAFSTAVGLWRSIGLRRTADATPWERAKFELLALGISADSLIYLHRKRRPGSLFRRQWAVFHTAPLDLDAITLGRNETGGLLHPLTIDGFEWRVHGWHERDFRNRLDQLKRRPASA